MMPGMGGNKGQSNSGGKNNKNKNNKNKNKNNNSNNNANNNANNNTAEGLLEKNITSYKYIILVLVIILVLFIIGYFVSFSYRESKGLFNLLTGKDYIFIDSKVNTRAHRDKKLCDFFIAGAFRPYLVGNQRYDYFCSLKMLKEVLLMGVRSVYIDVFNNTLNENAFPIVTTGIKKGEWKLGLNSLNFEDVCVVIASTVFSNGYVNNFRDPFILCLNLNTNGNVKCLNRIKKTLYKIFRSNLLSNDYTYSSNNMAEVKVKDLLGKVIIFAMMDIKIQNLKN